MRRSNFAPTWREVRTQQKGGDNINLTQAEIDAIVKATIDKDGQEYKEIFGHGLFCIYCKSAIFMTDTNTHMVLTNKGCRQNGGKHCYVSEGRLRQLLQKPYIAAWLQKTPPVSTILKRRVLAVPSSEGKGGGGK